MNLENIIDDELIALQQAKQKAQLPNERRAYCVVQRGNRWEVMQHRDAIAQQISVPDYRVTKRRHAA